MSAATKRKAAPAMEASQESTSCGTPPAAAVTIPLAECVGQMVKCPECGHPCSVDNARGARTHTQVISSVWWVKTNCKPPGLCGSKLRKVTDQAELLEQPDAQPVLKTLAQAVGRFVRCPLPECGEQSLSVWRDDFGHTVQCAVHGAQAFPPDTLVEVLR